MDFKQIAGTVPMGKATWHDYFISQALMATARSDCTRRRFGAVIVDGNNRVLSAGYNAPPCGVKSAAQTWALNTDFDSLQAHKGKSAPPTACFKVQAGQGGLKNSGYDHCPALHAEQNAILDYGVRELVTAGNTTIYIAGRDGQTGDIIDSEPCIHCSRMIMQARIARVIFLKQDGTLDLKMGSKLDITPER